MKCKLNILFAFLSGFSSSLFASMIKLDRLEMSECPDNGYEKCIAQNEKKVRAYNKSSSASYSPSFLKCEAKTFKNYGANGVLLNKTEIRKKKNLCEIHILKIDKKIYEICQFNQKEREFFTNMKKNKPPVEKIKALHKKRCQSVEFPKNMIVVADKTSRLLKQYTERRKNILMKNHFNRIRGELLSSEKLCAGGDELACKRFKRAKKSMDEICSQPKYKDHCK